MAMQNGLSNLQIVQKEKVHHIKYFIKFYAEKQYCSHLLNGELFMQSASHYWHIEQHQAKKYQADLNDSRVYHCAGVNSNRPIYCMYIIYDTDIRNNQVAFSNQLLMDFCGENDDITKVNAVIMQASEFLQQVDTTLRSKNLFAYSGIVEYDKSDAKDKWLLQNKLWEAICLFKYPIFQHQKEYRIQMHLECSLKRCEVQGIHYKNDSDVPKEYDSYKLKIGAISDIAQYFTYNDLLQNRDSYILNLPF